MLKAKPCSHEGCNRPSWKAGKCPIHSLKSDRTLVRGTSLSKSKGLRKQSEKYKEGKEDRIAYGERMMQLFEEHWNSYERKECFACGKPIWGENLTIYSDHLIEKSYLKKINREDLIFDLRNLVLVCGDCHTNKTNANEKYQAAIDNAYKTLL